MTTPEKQTAGVRGPAAATHAANEGNAATTITALAPLLVGRTDRPDGWPDPMGEEAFHGPIGRFVKAIEGKTEADPAAMMIGGLVAFGNLVGRGPFHRTGGAGGGMNHANLYAIVIGETSRGRKGTAWSEVAALFREVDPDWSRSSIKGGISTGEGLVFHVRDKVVEVREAGPDEQHKANSDGMVETVLDPGVEDKRLLAREGEFSQVLEVATRTGTTVTVRIRDFWDKGEAGTLTRSNSLEATDAHISMIGDVTPEELTARMSKLDLVNGFLNRFVLIASRKSVSLPYPEDIDPAEFEEIAAELRDNAETAAAYGRMMDHPETRPIWIDFYRATDQQDHPKPLKDLLARALPHVRRLSVVYALADGTNVIEPQHLRAALAVWDYAEATARYVFGDTYENPTVHKIHSGLLRTPAGMTTTEINNGFHGHKSADEIRAALAELEEAGKVKPVEEKTGGRPAIRWVATGCGESEISGESTGGGTLIPHDPHNPQAVPEDGPGEGDPVKAAWAEAVKTVGVEFNRLPESVRDQAEPDPDRLAELEAAAKLAADAGSESLALAKIREWQALHLDRIRKVAATDDQDRLGEAA